MIVNTRPSILANKTNELLARSGVEFMHEPLTKILSISPSNQALKRLQQLDSYDVIIFTSQSAAKFGAPYLQKHGSKNLNLLILAIGLATQRVLNEHGLISEVPSDFNSAGLAELIEQSKYEKCLVFCGDKKPQLNLHTQVELDTFSCYKVVDEESDELNTIIRNRKAIFLIYNIQTLEVLIRHAQAADLVKLNLVVASARIQETALIYGIKGCVVSKSPHDEEMTEAAIKFSKA
jgi:uroporphyrinogen-III synthase|tara:strand:+ start:18 stop:722 length:705 start_codon:yes stop_codon:yes gene_type:complete